MKKAKLYTLVALVLGGGTLFASGCGGGLNGFWQGMFNTGWPNNNRWLNLTIDILNEELFG